MIRLADYDVYATDEGLFILKQGESNVTKVARPKDMHALSDDLAAAWRDVQGEAGDLPAAPKKSPDKPARRSKGAGDYDPTENKCKECGSNNLFMSEGCMTCQDCAWSKCS